MDTTKNGKNWVIDDELNEFKDELEKYLMMDEEQQNPLLQHRIMGIRLTRNLDVLSEDIDDYINRFVFTLDEGNFITMMVTTTMSYERFMSLWMEAHKVCLTIGGKDFMQVAQFRCKPCAKPDTYLIYGRVSWSYIMRVGHQDISVSLFMGEERIPFRMGHLINVFPAKIATMIEPVDMYLQCSKEDYGCGNDFRNGIADDDKKDECYIWFACKNTFPPQIEDELLMEVEFRIYDENDNIMSRDFSQGIPVEDGRTIVSMSSIETEDWANGFYRVSAFVWGKRVADIIFVLGTKKVGKPSMHIVKGKDKDDERLFVNKSSDTSVKAIDRIRRMIGLSGVKRHLEQNICYVKMMEARRKAGLPCGNRLMHVIMTGAPGTGKTTVARLLGKAYKEMDILSSGHTVECNRATLVQDHIGGTEKATQEKIEEAKGGVLFIDEAYSMLSERQMSNDFGVRIIDTLMTILSDPESDILVVLAGYEDEMEKLLKSNPGLASRFPVRLHFPDYSIDELMQMAESYFNDNGYKADAKVQQRIRDIIGQAVACQSFGAGRFIHTLIENTILPNMATRLFAKGVSGKMDSAVLSRILPQDVPAPDEVITRLNGTQKKVRAIGFR